MNSCLLLSPCIVAEKLVFWRTFLLSYSIHFPVIRAERLGSRISTEEKWTNSIILLKTSLSSRLRLVVRSPYAHKQLRHKMEGKTHFGVFGIKLTRLRISGIMDSPVSGELLRINLSLGFIFQFLREVTVLVSWPCLPRIRWICCHSPAPGLLRESLPLVVVRLLAVTWKPIQGQRYSPQCFLPLVSDLV